MGAESHQRVPYDVGKYVQVQTRQSAGGGGYVRGRVRQQKGHTSEKQAPTTDHSCELLSAYPALWSSPASYAAQILCLQDVIAI